MNTEALLNLQELLSDEFLDSQEKEACELSLAMFTRLAWPIIEPGTKLVWSWYLSTICGYLEAFHFNRLPDKRLIVSINPGAMKSILVSVMYPAWVWCTDPTERFLTVSNEQGLAIRDSRRMKQIVTSEWYQKHWPIMLAQDQNEKILFSNSANGHRQAQGITASNSGKRSTCLIIDDPIDTKKAYSDLQNQTVLDTYDQSLSTRLNDMEKSGILVIMQRTRHDDLAGHLRRKVKSHWTSLSIPLVYEGTPTFDAGIDIKRPDLNDPRKKKGELMFPERFSAKVVASLSEDLGEYGFAAQCQQRPSPLGGGILKKHHFRIWPDDIKLPRCEHIFLSLDTAFSEKDSKTSSFSACTRYGIFWHEQRERYCILVLGCWFARLGYDELRAKVKEMDKKYSPDILLIEKKATGITLVQDMQRAVPGRVKAYTPGRGEDKISRAHSVSPMVQSGLCYVPGRIWALGNDKDKMGLLDYLAQFPTGAPPCEDLCDSFTQALIYMRSGGWVEHPDDKHEFGPIMMPTEESEEDHAADVVRSAYGG